MPASSVTVTSLSRHHHLRRHRSLLAAGTATSSTSSTSTTVAFTEALPAGSSASAATAMASSITAMAASSAFASSLRVAGLPVTGVAVALAPSISFSSSVASSSQTGGATAAQTAATLSVVASLLSSVGGGGNGSTAVTVAPPPSKELVSTIGSAATLLNTIAAPAAGNGSSGGGSTAQQQEAALAVQRQVEQQREGLLSLLATSLLTASSSASGGQPQQLSADLITDTAAAVVQLTSAPTQLTPSAQSAAVSALSALQQSGGSSLKVDTASLMVTSLDSIVTAATAGGSTVNATASEQQGVLSGVLAVVDGVSRGQGAQLTDTAGPPVVISTSSIQISMRLDDPSAQSPSAGSSQAPRLFTEPFTAPGSESSFDPLPPDAFAGGGGATGPLVSQFLSLAFDPYSPKAASRRSRSLAADGSGDGDAAASGRQGITRLAFTRAGDGSEVAVKGLRTPITFQLLAPGRNLSSPSGSKAVCQFWDVAAAAFSSAGCVALPDPLPRGLAAQWRANFTANSAADLVLAWELVVVPASAADNGGNSSLTPGGAAAAAFLAGCEETVLDCRNETQAARFIFPDPLQPLRFPAVECGGVAPRVLRVLHGSACAAWRADNALRCAWNNTAQAFSGSGCEAQEATFCACTHLTGAKAEGDAQHCCCPFLTV